MGLSEIKVGLLSRVFSEVADKIITSNLQVYETDYWFQFDLAEIQYVRFCM